MRRTKVEDCKGCDPNEKYHPPHDASERCESGKRPHCTCDRCF